MNKPVINVALLQLTSVGLNQQVAIEKGEAFCRNAEKHGADLVLFPEMWNVCYDLSYLERDETYLQEWRMYAIKTDSEFVKYFQALAIELGIAIALTYLESTSAGACSTVSLIDRFGRIAMTYAKVHLAAFERQALVAGDDYCVCDLNTHSGKIRVGAMICYDMAFPETARILRLKGADLILIPLADGINSHKTALLRTRSYDNQIGIAMTNYYHPDPRETNGMSVAFDGIAYDKNGSEREMTIAHATNGECMTIARFQIGDLREFRSRDSGALAHRRPETYNELVRR